MPVLAVKDGGITVVPPDRILLPVDFSTHSQRATNLAITLARRWNADIDVLHVRDNVPDYMAYASAAAIEFDKDMLVLAAEKLEAIATMIREKKVSATTHLPEGIAPIQIAEKANELKSDLIVMGTHGLTGLSHVVIGSVTERTLRLAQCPVLITNAAPEVA